jgi:hypothetical protein
MKPAYPNTSWAHSVGFGDGPIIQRLLWGSKAIGKNIIEKPYKIGHFQWGNRFGVPQF